MDQFPSHERAATVATGPRVTAIVHVRDVSAQGARRAALDLCLRSVLAEPLVDELVIVDHGNPAAISSALRALQADRRDVRVLSAETREGVAEALNRGAASASGRLLMFLTSDVVLRRGAAKRLVEAVDSTSATPCIVGGALSDTAGRALASARTGPLNTFSSIALALRLRAGRRVHRRRDAETVSAVSRALMLISKADFQALDGFSGAHADADDLDLCVRAAARGGEVRWTPAAAGVQVVLSRSESRDEARGLAAFAQSMARSGLERTFAACALPVLLTLVSLRDFVAGRPKGQRR